MRSCKTIRWLKKDIHQSFFVVAMAAGIIVGTILAINFRVNYFDSLIWLMTSLLALVLAYFRPKVVFMILAFVSGMIMIFYRASHELAGASYIRGLYGETITVSGIINGDPKKDESNIKIKLCDLKIEEKNVAGCLYVSFNKKSEVIRGDELSLFGKIEEGFGTYVGYIDRPKIIGWKRADPGDLVVRIRNWFSERIKVNVPEDEASLGLSYLLGMKTGLSDELNQNLRIVGLVHIVVASGAHLAILVEIARKIFGKITRLIGVVMSVMFILFFMAMVGWTPSIMRAGIMSIINLLAWYVGRKIKPWRIILIVSATTLMINPMFLIDLGWLLSFASFIGIMSLSPKLKKLFYGEREPKFVASMIITTISATLMTLPITLYYYGTISLISVVANLLILPTLPYAMGLTFLSGVVAGFPLVQEVISWFATRMIDFHILVINTLGGMEQFLIEIPQYKWEVFLIYIIVVSPFLIGLIKKKMVKFRKE